MISSNGLIFKRDGNIIQTIFRSYPSSQQAQLPLYSALNLVDDEWAMLLVYDYRIGDVCMPVNNKILKLLSSISENVSFIFNFDMVVGNDYPMYRSLDDDDECWDYKTNEPKEVDPTNVVLINAKNDQQKISILSQYLIWKSLNYLPYADFAIDQFPTIDQVLVDGKVSDIFEKCEKEMQKIISTHLSNNQNTILVMKNDKYKFISSDDLFTKKVVHAYIQICWSGSQTTSGPLFMRLPKRELKSYMNIDHIETTLQYYSKENTSEDPAMASYDDYMSSSNSIHGIIHLIAVASILVNCKLRELQLKDSEYALGAVIDLYTKKMNDGSINPNAKSKPMARAIIPRISGNVASNIKGAYNSLINSKDYLMY